MTAPASDRLPSNGEVVDPDLATDARPDEPTPRTGRNLLELRAVRC